MPGVPIDLRTDVTPDTSHIEIVIVIELGANAHDYNAQRETAGRMRPVACPGCEGKRIVAHDWYERRAVYPDEDVLVAIRRWRCKACGKTISLLPSFLHRHRHYALIVIETVLRGRLEQNMPWSDLSVASQRSMRRWLAALVAQALGWLARLLTALARVMPLLGMLDAHGSHANQTPASAVLRLGSVFASWLCPEIRDNALRVLWRWGWNDKAGRLV